jgi:hypothetical protein
MDWLEIFVPFPLRWAWLALFGLACFRLSMLALSRGAAINGPACIQDNEQSDSVERFPALFNQVLPYAAAVYLLLRAALPFLPLFLVPPVELLVVSLALIQPLNIGGLALRYRFLGYTKRRRPWPC